MTDRPAAQIRRVEQVMGTAFGVTVDPTTHHDPPRISGGSTASEAVEQAFAWPRWVDRTFSTYRPDREISRLDRGGLATDDASPEVREVLVRCAELTELTDGWFTAQPSSRGPTRLDPSGLVKGWSIDRAGLLLRMAGFRRLAVNGGGDIVCATPDHEARPWHVGIRHPRQPGAVAVVLDVQGSAIATSSAGATSGAVPDRPVGVICSADRRRSGARHGRCARHRSVRRGIGRSSLVRPVPRV